MTLWMAAIIAGSMAVYAGYEYATMPNHKLRQLAVEHLSHVIVLGFLIYGLCYGVFYFLLLRPLNRIYLHLYTVGAGRFQMLDMDTNVREIRTIVDGVNLMFSRLKEGADKNALDLVQRRMAEIRALVMEMEEPNHQQVSVLLGELNELENRLQGIIASQCSRARVASLADRARPAVVAMGDSVQ